MTISIYREKYGRYNIVRVYIFRSEKWPLCEIRYVLKNNLDFHGYMLGLLVKGINFSYKQTNIVFNQDQYFSVE